jgi:hypothetical protein
MAESKPAPSPRKTVTFTPRKGGVKTVPAKEKGKPDAS